MFDVSPCRLGAWRLVLGAWCLVLPWVFRHWVLGYFNPVSVSRPSRPNSTPNGIHCSLPVHCSHPPTARSPRPLPVHASKTHARSPRPQALEALALGYLNDFPPCTLSSRPKLRQHQQPVEKLGGRDGIGSRGVGIRGGDY